MPRRSISIAHAQPIEEIEVIQGAAQGRSAFDEQQQPVLPRPAGYLQVVGIEDAPVGRRERGVQRRVEHGVDGVQIIQRVLQRGEIGLLGGRVDGHDLHVLPGFPQSPGIEVALPGCAEESIRVRKVSPDRIRVPIDRGMARVYRAGPAACVHRGDRLRSMCWRVNELARVHFFIDFPGARVYTGPDESHSSLKGIARSRNLPMEVGVSR
jgi:hypothetical protein